MNINPNAKRILCYGDSNTWGDTPDKITFRYPVNIRWTGQLQQKLGDGFEIVEEGLCGRTTTIDDPKEEGRNGKVYLKPCLQTHNPLDLIILMLGTNDLKERFNLSTYQISKNIEELIIIIKNNGLTKDNKSPTILLISPILVNEHSNIPMEGMKGAGEKSKQFAKLYEQVAIEQKCQFVNLSQYVEPSKIDGCHLDPDSHTNIAEVFEQKIKYIFNYGVGEIKGIEKSLT
jgi:lysophospholipase L1-like esterase